MMLALPGLRKERKSRTVCKWNDGEIDNGANGGVIVERDEGVHFEIVEEDLDEY